MKKYKNFYGTREQYIAYMIDQVRFWAKAFADEMNHREAMLMALNNAEEMLANEGYDWDAIEAIEVAAMA